MEKRSRSIRIVLETPRSGSAITTGAHLTQLTSFRKGKAGTPRWSPDGRFVAFDYRAADTSDAYIANIAGGAPRCITAETQDDSVPSWSHDGNFIYLQSNRSGRLQIWRVPVAGGPATQVTQNGGFYSFESEDGKYLYYNNPTYSTPTRSSGVWRVPVEGGEAELVLDQGNAGTWGTMDYGWRKHLLHQHWPRWFTISQRFQHGIAKDNSADGSCRNNRKSRCLRYHVINGR